MAANITVRFVSGIRDKMPTSIDTTASGIDIIWAIFAAVAKSDTGHANAGMAADATKPDPQI